MRIRVLVSYRGTLQSQSWHDDTEQDCSANWEKCANAMINYAAKKGEYCQIEIFLFLRSGFWHEYNTLKNYLKLVHQYTWLANEIYLVVDRRIGRGHGYESIKPSLDKWFEEISNLSIRDIIHDDVDGISEVFHDEDSISEFGEKTLDKLKNLVNISQERRKILNKILNLLDPLTYKVFWQFNDLENFIGEIGNESISEKDASNEILILEGDWKSYRVEIHGLLQSISGEKFIAICTTDVNRELVNYAKANKIDIIKFSGFFDLRYFLNLYYLLQSTKSDTIVLIDNPSTLSIEEMVSAKGEKVFGKFTDFALDKAILISSAFDPKNNSINDLLNPQASKTLFELFAEHDINRFVIPVLTTDNLSGHLERMPQDLIVWTHFGHGQHTGLQDFEGLYKITEEWLKSFQGKRKSLRLAFFFSCESTNVAKKFVESGVSIAIGFDTKVLMDDCMQLAKIIIPIALKSGDDKEILTAFNQRCKMLGDAYLDRCKPRIFIQNNVVE